MKKNNYKYILIFSVFVIFITIYIIINNNIKIESLNFSQYIDTSDNNMIKYDNLYGGSCFIECKQQTIPNKCNYALMSGDFQTQGPCTLYNKINNATNSTNNILYYMEDITIPTLSYVKTIDKGYYTDANLIKEIDNVHKVTCDYECAYTNDCTSYTTQATIANDSNKAGTCKLYKGTNTNNTIYIPGTNIYTKPSYFQ